MKLDMLKKDLKNIKLPIFLFLIYDVIVHLIWNSICPMVIITGIPCPGCGLTRAAKLLLQLRFADAWKMHPFIYPIVMLAVLFFIFRYVLDKRINILIVLTVILGGLMILYYIYRMYRYFPNDSPMTYYYDSILYQLFKLYKLW
ncbi:DUF2752 domain-containing protein [Lachnospiraceae bacterium LCP25S3_G4]